MALRVTARLAQRLGRRPPSQASATGNSARPSWALLSAARCRAKWGVLATGEPAMTAWNCCRDLSRWTTAEPPGSVSGWVGQADAGGTACAGSDSQTLAALGATGVDHSTATTGLHANEKAVGAGAFDFGRLVGAFHDGSVKIGETRNYRKETRCAASTWRHFSPRHLSIGQFREPRPGGRRALWISRRSHYNARSAPSHLSTTTAQPPSPA